MTQGERDRIRGQAIREWEEAKHRLAALEAQARDAAILLNAVSAVLLGKGTCFEIQDGQFRLGLENGKIVDKDMRAEWPSWEIVRKLASDVGIAKSDLLEAERQKAALGV